MISLRMVFPFPVLSLFADLVPTSTIKYGHFKIDCGLFRIDYFRCFLFVISSVLLGPQRSITTRNALGQAI